MSDLPVAPHRPRHGVVVEHQQIKAHHITYCLLLIITVTKNAVKHKCVKIMAVLNDCVQRTTFLGFTLRWTIQLRGAVGPPLSLHSGGFRFFKWRGHWAHHLFARLCLYSNMIFKECQQSVERFPPTTHSPHKHRERDLTTNIIDLPLNERFLNAVAIQ